MSKVTTRLSLCTRTSAPGYGFTFHEIFYSENDLIIGYNKQPFIPMGEDEHEITDQMYAMWRALELSTAFDLDQLDRDLISY